MAENLIYKDTANFIVLREMRNLAQGANSFFTGTATVTMTLQTTGGTSVSGQVFPASLTYNSSKGRGTFEGTLEATLDIALWTHYDLIIAISGSGIPARQHKIRLFCANGLFQQ